MRAYFAEIGLPLDSCSNPQLFATVCEWTDVPYKYARCSKSGVDCSGLSKQIYRSVYNLDLKGGSRDLYHKCQPVPKEALIEGDFVFFKIYSDRISHVGVYLGNNKFVHASTKRGVIVSDLDETYYKKRFFRGGRIVLPTSRPAKPQPAPPSPEPDTNQTAPAQPTPQTQ